MKKSSEKVFKQSKIKMCLGRAILWLCGWKVEGEVPSEPKLVVIGAPHTTNWDFILSFGVAFYHGIQISWIGKKSLFTPPFGYFMRFIGGIPVDRKSRHNFVDQMAEAFQKKDELFLCIAPEGTRKRSEYWKTGFYYIALQAKVPIILAFFDYKRKACGFKSVIVPSGDIESDMAILCEHYKDVTPKYPENCGPMQLKPKTDSPKEKLAK